jgi:hypothetical protein
LEDPPCVEEADCREEGEEGADGCDDCSCTGRTVFGSVGSVVKARCRRLTSSLKRDCQAVVEPLLQAFRHAVPSIPLKCWYWTPGGYSCQCRCPWCLTFCKTVYKSQEYSNCRKRGLEQLESIMDLAQIGCEDEQYTPMPSESPWGPGFDSLVALVTSDWLKNVGIFVRRVRGQVCLPPTLVQVNRKQAPGWPL